MGSNDVFESEVSGLIRNTAEMQAAAAEKEANLSDKHKKREMRDADESKAFRRFKIKDIVFLAIVNACTLITSAIMPLLVNVPVFGIVQIGLGLQFSLFSVIGLMKVRKAGSLSLMGIIIALFLLMMFPPMALIALCAIISELIALALFRSYKKDRACVLAGTLYMPLSTPLLLLYYNVFYTSTGGENLMAAMFILDNSYREQMGLDPVNGWVIGGICVAIVAVSFIGAMIGMVVSRELKKAGVLKK